MMIIALGTQVPSSQLPRYSVDLWTNSLLVVLHEQPILLQGVLPNHFFVLRAVPSDNFTTSILVRDGSSIHPGKQFRCIIFIHDVDVSAITASVAIKGDTHQLDRSFVLRKVGEDAIVCRQHKIAGPRIGNRSDDSEVAWGSATRHRYRRVGVMASGRPWGVPTRKRREAAGRDITFCHKFTYEIFGDFSP